MANALGISNVRASGDGQQMMVDDSGQPHAAAIPGDANMPTPGNISTLAMFVPVHEDLTRPFDDAPRSRLDRARATLQSIDTHRTGVRRGLVHLGLLEQQRILADMGPRRDIDEERDPDLMGPIEADTMLANMRAPAVPGYSYSVTDVQMAQPIPLEWPPAAGERPGGRREAARRQQMLHEKVMTQMANYEGHIREVRAQWTSALEREEKRLQAQFGTPDVEEPTRSNTSGSGSGGGRGNGTGLGIAASLPALQTNVGRAAADAKKTTDTDPAKSPDKPTTEAAPVETTATGVRLASETTDASTNSLLPVLRPPTVQLPARPDVQRPG